MKYIRQQAFSLIETLTTLLVLGILLSIATPGLSAYLQNAQQKTQLNQLISALHYARSKAITSGGMVTLCAGDAQCSGSKRWQQQLLLFADGNHNGQLDLGDELYRLEPVAANYSWDWSNFRNQNHMTYKPDGTTHSLNGTFTLCHGGQAKQAVVVNPTGRARLSATTTSERCTQ